MRRRRRGGPAHLQQQQQLVRQRLPARGVHEVVACGEGRDASWTCRRTGGRELWDVSRTCRVDASMTGGRELGEVALAAEERVLRLRGDMGRYGEIWGDLERYGEIWGDKSEGRSGSAGAASSSPPLPSPPSSRAAQASRTTQTTSPAPASPPPPASPSRSNTSSAPEGVPAGSCSSKASSTLLRAASLRTWRTVASVPRCSSARPRRTCGPEKGEGVPKGCARRRPLVHLASPPPI